MTFRRGLGLVLLATAPLLAQAATPARGGDRRRSRSGRATRASGTGGAGQDPRRGAVEGRGDSDLATEHVRAISRIDAAAPVGREQVAPLYWEQPQWSSLQRKPSRRTVVVVEFGIDADGFVSSPTIVESAGKALDDLILATIERWRYAPPLVDGEPVGIERVRYSFSYGRRGREQPQLGTKIRGLDPLRGPSDGAPLGDVMRGGLQSGG